MHENKVKIGLWFVAFATLFIIGVFVSIFVFSNEKGSITETLKKERALYDPYQTLKNKEIREVNKNWNATDVKGFIKINANAGKIYHNLKK